MAPHYHLVFLLPDLNSTVCIGACPAPFPSSSAPAAAPGPAPGPAPVVFPAWAVPSPAPVVFAASPRATLPLLPTYPETKHQLLRTLLVVVASVFATCALLLTYYIVLRRYRSLRHRRAGAAAGQPPAPAATLARSDTDDELREDLLAAGAADQPYHVWHIRTVGLDELTIGAISAVAYRKGEGLVEGTDCAVCLGEFRDRDMLRLLPKCSHAFHIPCIDTWLRSHLNCPLCRAPILSPAPPPPATVAAANATASSSPSSSSSAASAVGDHPGSSQEEPEIWMQIDLGDGGSEDGGGRARSGAPPAPEDGGNVSTTLQRVRRSVSMDPSALGGLLQRMGLVGAADEEGGKPISEEHPSAAPKERGRRRNNRRAASLMDAGPPEMERSMSSGGGRLFPSMFSGRTRGAILPL